MSDERRNDGASAAVAVILVVLVLLVLVAGGGGALIFLRKSSAAQLEMMEARAQAEMFAVQAERQRAALEATLAAQNAAAVPASVTAEPPEIVLEIDAAGNYKLDGKAMEYYDDLKAALLEAHIAQGDDLQVVIRAHKDVKFDRVTKAIEAAECAGINKHRIATSVQPAP